MRRRKTQTTLLSRRGCLNHVEERVCESAARYGANRREGNPLTRSGSSSRSPRVELLRSRSLAEPLEVDRLAKEQKPRPRKSSDPSPKPLSRLTSLASFRGSQSWLQEPAAIASRVLNYALILVMPASLSSLSSAARQTAETNQFAAGFGVFYGLLRMGRLGGSHFDRHFITVS
jgi:hypothetical protein